MDTGLVLGVLVAAGACFGAYAAIRADLARLHERVTAGIDAAHKAHKRIDDLVSSRFDRRTPGGASGGT